MTYFSIKTITCGLFLTTLGFASSTLAESSIKEVKDFEKCIKTAIKQEAKQKKPKIRKLHKKCGPELEALSAFADQARSQGLVIDEEDKLRIGPAEPIDTVN